MKLFSNTLNSTAQPNLYYADTSNLPKEVQEMILDGEIEFFKELSGGGTRIRLNDVKIHGWIYDLVYTIDYIQDFDNSYEDMDEDEIETEMFQRAEVFLADGLVNNVYLEVVHNDMKFAVKVRNMHDASTDLIYFEADEGKEAAKLIKELEKIDREDYTEENSEDYTFDYDMIISSFNPQVLENINWRKMKKDEDSIDSEIYVDEITDDYFIVLNKVSIDIY